MPIPSPVHILANVHADRAVIQDFRPLADSIEWQIGQSYLRERGNKAFTSDPEPIPFTINNDGNLSQSAAEVFLASLVAADRAGTLEPDIFVLELGIGVGLFARFFLDAFRELCVREDKDYYDRLCYVAGDYSAKMLRDAGRHGLFAQHPGRYVFRVVDALCPGQSLAQDATFSVLDGPPFQAVFLNYLLDCLPACVFKVEGEEVRQLYVRSCLARGSDLGEVSPLSAEELARLAPANDPQPAAELRQVYDLLVSEYEYRPVDPMSVPYGEAAVRFARATGQGLVVHNYGAVQALEGLLSLVRETGFILINDYGQVALETAGDFQHQRYSQSTFIGINFPFLKSYFSDQASSVWVDPSDEGQASIHARLLARRPAAETVTCFQDRFGKAAQDERQEPVQRARAGLKVGQFEAALAAYEQALERQPYNWALMNEVAHFLTFSLHNPRAGLELARAALACNPACSTDLWNVLGDSLFELGRIEDARQAYLHALRINPEDARAHFNLTFVHVRTREFTAALHRITEALILDRAGTYRERLLQTQSEVLAQLSRRQQQEALRKANRINYSPGKEVSDVGRPSQVVRTALESRPT